jgi:hypothetical protein
VSRNSAGSVSSNGTSLPETQHCVKVAMQYSWTGANHLPMTRTLATVLTKGGL